MGCTNCFKHKEVSGNRIVYALRRSSAQLGDDAPMKNFCTNAIISSRYTLVNFIPKNLFEQFHNIANIFFAAIAILYTFASPATSIWANLGPLVAILAITMIKDGVEDLFRHRRDRLTNRALFCVLQVDEQEKVVHWNYELAESIRVGDIVLCEKDRILPCDLVALCSSHDSTAVYLTTANLDGETNVKKIYAVNATQSTYESFTPANLSNSANKPGDFYGLLDQLYVRVECSAPSEDLGKFEGRLTTYETSNINLSTKNLLLRGCKLHNTEFVIGLVVYTGRETKLSLNGKHSRRKYSSRDARSNVILLCFIFGMIILSVLLAVVFTIVTTQTKDTQWYIPVARQTAWEFVLNVFRFVVISNYLIPISIIFTVEFQQILLAFFISNDLRMYDKKEDLVAKANSSQFADELGQVEFLFSDKTGTLTQNLMWLSVCAVIDTDKIYEFQRRPVQQASHTTASAFKSLGGGISESVSSSSSSDSDTEDSSLVSGSRLKQGNGRLKPDASPELLRFLTMSALCHTVEVSDVGLSGSESYVSQRRMYNYEATSPDEKALVEGAARLGVVYAGCQPAVTEPSILLYTIEYWPDDFDVSLDKPVEVKQYFVDAILEFTSTRKRMSVMVRYPDGTCHVHSKGAEISMLAPEVCSKYSPGLYKSVMQRASEIAAEGYRTLVFSSRQLEEMEYRKLLKELQEANGMFGEDRQRAIKDVYATIERDLRPMYVTGVEDVLYPGVKKCLNNLREAGIQVWILTGDKEETAITVSQAAGHFTPQMGLIRMTRCPDYATAACWVFEQLDGIQARLDMRTRGIHRFLKRTSIAATSDEVNEAYLTAAEKQLTERRSGQHIKDRLRHLRTRLQTFMTWGPSQRERAHRRRRRRRAGAGGEPIGLVVDGKTLSMLLDPTLREAFLDLCMNVTTVLCCRLTPLQKASIVHLIQAGLSGPSSGGSKPITAAIGDGGNDVAMLLQASIGVGIYGKEGLDAARAADYSLPSFEHLTQLFLLHGNWAYHRITFTMDLFYYKCTALVTTQILLGFHSGFSQMVSISSLLFALYNLTMTSVNCLLYGMFERHLPEKELLSLPYLYRAISRQANLRAWFVLLWVLEGIWAGSIIYFLAIYCLGGGLDYAPAVAFDGSLNGRSTYDFWSIGTATYMYLWMAVNLRILILFRDWNGFIGLGYGVTAINIALFYASNRIIFVALVASPTFWLTMIPTLYMTCFPAFIWRMLSDMWWNMHIYLSSIPQRRIRHKQRRDWKCWLSALSQGKVTKNARV